jgi:hypothetical protein
VASVHKPEPVFERAGEITFPSYGAGFFDDELLPVAAWRLLFELYSREANGQTTEICDLLSTPRVPAQSARRYVDLMIDMKLINLPPGPGHRFRRVTMSPDGFAALRAKMLSNQS